MGCSQTDVGVMETMLLHAVRILHIASQVIKCRVSVGVRISIFKPNLPPKPPQIARRMAQMSHKGHNDYQRFQKGQKLGFKAAILAQCYVCNGEDEGGVDCEAGDTCPLYQHMPYNPNKNRRERTEAQKIADKQAGERLRKQHRATKT